MKEKKEKSIKGQESKKTPLSINLSLMTMLPIGSHFYVECEDTRAAHSYKFQWNKTHPDKKINIEAEKQMLTIVTSLDHELKQSYLIKIKVIPYVVEEEQVFN